MTTYLLGIDNGGTVSKVVIFDVQGNEIQVSSRKVAAEFPREGWAERQLARVWHSTAEAIQEALTVSGINPADIAAVGNTAHGNGIYLLDKAGKPLRPAILSIDTRAEKFIARWKAAGVNQQVWSKTYQQLWAGQTSALLAWIKQHEPEKYQAIGAVLLSKDYIKFCLTGALTTDFSDMSSTNLLDLKTRNYSPEALAAFGIEAIKNALPSLAESYDVIGKITPAAAQATGLKAGTPVVGGIFDVSACALGVGVIQPGHACIIAGTWSINEVVTADVIDDPQLFMNSIYTPQSYMAIEASPTSAANLEWFISEFCAEEKAQAAAQGISVYEICNTMIEAIPPTNIIFHPFLFGSNVQPTARAGFYGVGGWHTRAHLLRAVYEGVVYGHLSHIEKLRKTGINLEAARFTGGGARSHVWTQMFADALGIPIEVVKGEEMGARGAAMCAGMGVGVYRDYADAIAQVVQVERHHEPDPQMTALYQKRYQEQQYLVHTMQDAWNRLSQLNADV